MDQHWCSSHNPDPPDMRRLLTRRGFLRAGLTVTAAGTVASLGSRPAWAAECVDSVGTIPAEQRSIQLFTLLAAMLASPDATLQGLAQIGYRFVEHAGFGSSDAAGFRASLEAAGIASPTGHTGITHPFDRDQVMGLIEDAHVTGTQWLINPSANFDSEADWAAFGETLNQAGALAIENGLLGAGHHNHSQEYRRFSSGPRRPIDALMEVCDPSVTSMEMDLCWVWASETDPVEYLQKYPNRYRWFHVKDLDPETGQPTFPGQGVIDFDRIFAAASFTQQIEHYIIEQDFAPSGFEAAQLGWDLLERAEFPCDDGQTAWSTSSTSSDCAAPAPPPDEPPAVDDVTTSPEPLPATGAGLVSLGLLAIGGGAILRRRREYG